MEITNDFLKKYLTNIREIILYNSTTLLKFNNIILTNNYCVKNKDLLINLERIIELNICSMSLCNELLHKLEHNQPINNIAESLSTLSNSILNITKFINNFLIELVDNKEQVSYINDNKSTISENSNIEEIQDNDILLISEKLDKVILPYTVSELKQLLNKDNEYSSLQDIIEQEYTLPLKKFSNPVVSRFKQAYHLSRNKEKLSIFASLDLAFELAFNYNLHPAVIAACKNIDELDIYLSYLEDNETEKFNIFKIQYEFLPTVTKK